MEMSKILDCTMINCSYNRDEECHALGITVGSDCAMCDTYIDDDLKGGEPDSERSGVGACRVKECAYNSSLECSAPGIHVGTHLDHPDCLTYKVI